MFVTSIIFCNFVAWSYSPPLPLMDFKTLLEKSKHYLLNKYVITCFVAAVILVCCGEQSLIHRVQLQRQINRLEKELSRYQDRLDYYNHAIEELEGSAENRERFAREQYYMHAGNEDVYLINEDD